MAIVRLDSFRTLGFAAISGVYAAVGTPIQHNWRVVEIINNTNGDMIFSVDAINDNLFVPKNSFFLLDIATNGDQATGASTLVFELFTQFYVKQSTAANAGDVYIQGFYARGE